MLPKLKVETKRVEELAPYVGNAKLHSAEQIDQIAASIEQFGFNDPIGVWTNEEGQLVIVEGHGRLMAAKLLGIEKVPVIRLDHMDDDARRAYVHVHNQTTLSSGFDLEALQMDLESIPGFDWSDFGFQDETDEFVDDTYTAKVDIPEYEIKGVTYFVDDLYECDKANELEKRIEESDLSDDEKAFLIAAAKRHTVFHYARIAEYYAQASREFQELAEESALVIIDINKAIANGYAKLNSRIEIARESDA